jgi:hypothetical protein
MTGLIRLRHWEAKADTLGTQGKVLSDLTSGRSGGGLHLKCDRDALLPRATEMQGLPKSLLGNE